MSQDRVFLFIDVLPEAIIHVESWLNSRNLKKPVVLVMEGSVLKNMKWNFDIFSERDFIATNSELEEKIYKEAFLKIYVLPMWKFKFFGVDLFPDLSQYLSIPYANIMVVTNAIKILLEKYSEVIICFDNENYSTHHFSLLEEAKDCKLAGSTATPLAYNKETKKIEERKSLYASTKLRGFPQLREIFSNLCKDFIKSFAREEKHECFSSLRKRFNEPLFFLTTSADLYRRNFIPIYKKFSQRLGKEPLLVGKSYLYQDAQKSGLKLFCLENLPYNNSLVIIKLIYGLLRLMLKVELGNKFSSFLKKRERMRYNMYSNQTAEPCEFSDKTFEKVWQYNMLYYNFFYKKAFDLMKDICKIDSLMKNISPKCIYKDTAVTVHDSLIQGLGRKHKCLVFSSIYASISESYRNFYMFYGDFFTTVGEGEIEVFFKHGFKKEQVLPVGQPELDDVLLKWTLEKSSSFIENSLRDFSFFKKTFLILTSCFDRQNEIVWINELIEYFSSASDFQLVIKPHVYAGEYYRSLKEKKNVLVLPHDFPIFPLLQVCSYVLTDTSHAGKFAIFFDKPLIVVNIGDAKFPIDYAEQGVAHLTNSLTELIGLIGRMLNNESIDLRFNYRSFIKKHLTSNDGKTCDRIFEAVSKLSFPNDLL